MSNLIKTTWLTVLLAISLSAVRMYTQTSSRIDHITEFYRHRDGFMGTVVVTRKGRIVFEKSYGYANVEKQSPFAQDTRFPIGSLSKQFTAAAILLLQEDGKLKTSDSIRQFYKDAPAAWAQITLRNLLTQTSGIPDFDFSESCEARTSSTGEEYPDGNLATIKLCPRNSIRLFQHKLCVTGDGDRACERRALLPFSPGTNFWTASIDTDRLPVDLRFYTATTKRTARMRATWITGG